MNNIFEEWNVYAGKRELKARDIDLESVEKNSKLKKNKSFKYSHKEVISIWEFQI